MIDVVQKTGDTELSALRALFRRANKWMLLMWRLGLGRFLASPVAGYIMILTTTGHKTGLQRRAPVNFEQEGRTVYCLAGFGKSTHWYRNLLANPHCEVWLPDGWWAGVAETVSDPGEKLRLLRRVLIRSGFAARLLEGVDPAALSDEDVQKLDRGYEVVRIRLVAERSGPGGPGDLAWVWPALGLALLYVIGVARRVRRRGGDA
ncbi:MAG: nitroreductase family deazaflavin-dependent oxidoreductase [Anaerolineae bacterium]|nr:nitroreductase family deazaflavin-dependent oxidoreductase [Anaerolineae bacterium]